ncbi:MAG TPA: S8 family peptidase [Candidatus Acidoferrum sp.]|nr:S8 family peptidase [Candidatus Acidoferrum sp.]
MAAIAMVVWLTASAAAQPGTGAFREDRILVKPKAGIDLAALTNFHQARQSDVLRTFDRIGHLQVLCVPRGETVPGLIARYQKSGLVEFAEPDYLGHVFNTTPNDPKYLDGTLWGLNNTGQGGGTADADIDAPEGWDVLTSASNIVVAVLDTGVRYTHEDLAANMWVNPHDGGHGWNTFTQTSDPADDNGHGTGVAGVLGAAGNNGKGVVGVAWRVQIMACKCFNNFGIGSVSDVVTCLDYARTNGARLINASWGFTNSLALSNAIASLRDAGIIVVAACGNSTTNIDLAPTYPASYALDNVVTVASLTRSNTLATSSNFGADAVDLAAPGENIYSTFAATDSFYINQSGTSFAAPYVTGACALLLAQFPADTHQTTISRLLSSTAPVPALAGKCRTGGCLKLAKVLRTIRLAAAPAASGAPFQVRVSGGLNRICVVETATNLTGWLPIFTNTTSADGTFVFTDDQSTNLLQRFYRATANP